MYFCKISLLHLQKKSTRNIIKNAYFSICRVFQMIPTLKVLDGLRHVPADNEFSADDSSGCIIC